MEVYITREFSKFSAKEDLSDQALCEAIVRAEQGLIDANLAGPIIKQRVARSGQGSSRGYRTIVVYQPGRLAVFLHGFAKSTKANLGPAEQDAFAEFGKIVLSFSNESIDAIVNKGKWRRIDCEQFRENVP